tara:strand:- start:237 stop:389 length:153 start_codon:yes stop_codon:yes gene_type:complete
MIIDDIEYTKCKICGILINNENMDYMRAHIVENHIDVYNIFNELYFIEAD